jgi:hypothetical protein
MIEEQRITKILFVAAVAIVFLNVANVFLGQPSWQITRLIGLDTESNFSTWFSGMILAIAAFFAYQVSVAAGPHRGCRTWQIVAFVLLFMSCDEVAMIHENAGEFIAKHFIVLSQTKHSAWLLVFGVPILIGVMFLARRINLYITSSKAHLFLGVGLLSYIAGAFLFESMLGLRFFPDLAKTTWLWTTEEIFEEGLEMLGVIMIIKGLQEQHKASITTTVLCLS